MSRSCWAFYHGWKCYNLFPSKSFMRHKMWSMQNGIHNNISNMLFSIWVIECMNGGVNVHISGQHDRNNNPLKPQQLWKCEFEFDPNVLSRQMPVPGCPPVSHHTRVCSGPLPVCHGDAAENQLQWPRGASTRSPRRGQLHRNGDRWVWGVKRAFHLSGKIKKVCEGIGESCFYAFFSRFVYYFYYEYLKYIYIYLAHFHTPL